METNLNPYPHYGRNIRQFMSGTNINETCDNPEVIFHFTCSVFETSQTGLYIQQL